MKFVHDECPRCGAKLDEPCRAEDGSVALALHPERLKKVER